MANQLLYAAVLVTTNMYDRASGSSRTATGTGVWVQGPNGSLSLITNRHIVEPAWDGDPGRRTYFTESVELRYFRAAGGELSAFPTEHAIVTCDREALAFHPDDTMDLAAIKADRCTPQPVGISFYVPATMIATETDFASVFEAGDVVLFPGYPEWLDASGDRPILRYGSIVSDPRNDYRLSQGPTKPGDGAKQFVFEALSVSGNSGSPVFAAEKGVNAGDGLTGGNHRPLKFIGINAGHYSTGASAHSGISRAHKSTAILELLANL